jgi:hypothetical protein
MSVAPSVVPSNCSNPTSGSKELYYDGVSSLACDDTVYTFYGSSDSLNARMADFLIGGASEFNTPAMVSLAMGIQENNGSGTNWMGVSTSVIDDFGSEFMATYNSTGQSFSTSDAQSSNAINAAVAMWYLRYCFNQMSSSYSGNDLLIAGINAYNEGVSAAGIQGAYAYSVLWKAYGNGWPNITSNAFSHSYMATGPSGTQARANTGATQAALPLPGFSVPNARVYGPIGVNSAGRRVIVLSATDGDYASGIIIEQWLQANSHVGCILTADASVAAYSAEVAGSPYCVICVGSEAVTAIQGVGLSLAEYSSFSSWESGSGSNPGYISAAGSSTSASYSLGLSAVQSASAGGWS